jgi:hypothetical protein
MDATTTHSIASLITKLAADYPHFAFMPAEEFRWNPKENTVFYDSSSNNASFLLHELAHAVLGHSEYARDIELIELERSAWEFVKKNLSRTYEVTLNDEIIEDSLDTYRDWLHARSTCPTCQSTGIETKKYEYKCIACGTLWKVNDARICALRRRILP